MRRVELTDGWEFCQRGGRVDYYQPAVAHLDWLPANVPGAVHLDLFRAGVIGDPFVGLHEPGLRWIDDADWSYRCSFEFQPQLARQVLRFEGLDTVCTAFLNGEEIARNDNMFVPLEVDVTGRLRLGVNELRVDFESAVRVGQERRQAYFVAEGIDHRTPFFDERAFVRKAGYMSGWDWGPRFVSCGIWKPVTLFDFDSRIEHVSVMQHKLNDGRYRVWFESNSEVGVEFNGLTRNPGEPLEFFVNSPRLWWPNGEGDQHLYPVRVFSASGESIERQVGLRTIRLIRNEAGSFEFEVNGRPIFARGANWIPNDSFVARAHDVAEQVDRCRALGMNMLRVWGGGVYESEAFYDACDQSGIMVWQDFPYACSYYPDGEAQCTSAAQEARSQILRLRDRTCLAVWCGNNENSAMWETSWGGSRPTRFYGSVLYDEVLPQVLSELDPGRDYIPTSPLVPDDESRSDSHFWDVWHGRGDWTHYVESGARFASEFGFASSCSLACWSSVLRDSDWDCRSVSVRWHDKTTKPVETFEGYVLAHYPHWRDLEEWVYFSQLNQRDALRCAIEHYRRSTFCRGALIWQFNDCWPVQSWAVQDHARLLKPAGFELARLYAPVLVSIVLSGTTAQVWVVNDSSSVVRAVLEVVAFSTADGSAVSMCSQEFECDASERKNVTTVSTRNCGILRASIQDDRQSATWQLVSEPKETHFGAPQIFLEGETVRVKGFARDLVLWDPDDAYNVIDPATGQPGWKAVTAANEKFQIGLRSRPAMLLARSMAGRHRVTIS